MYAEAEADLTDHVDRRLAQGITQAGWTERKLLETQVVHRELAGKIDQLASSSHDEVERVINDAYRAAAREVDLKFDTSLVAPRTKTRAVLAIEKSLRDGLAGTHFAILRQHDDLYRKVVGEASQAAAAGLATRDQVRRRMIGQFHSQGVTGFVDKRGRSWTLKSYTEMASRTAAAQAHLEGTVDRLGTLGVKFGKVSTSPSGCDLCQPWEGRIIQLSGPREDFATPTLDEAKAGGLFHPRCTHTVGAWIPGLTKGQLGRPSAAKAKLPAKPLEGTGGTGAPEWLLGAEDQVIHRPSGPKLGKLWDTARDVHNALGARGHVSRWRGAMKRNSRYNVHWEERNLAINWDPRLDRAESGLSDWNTIHELMHASSRNNAGYGTNINVGWEEGVADKMTELLLHDVAGDLGWSAARIRAAEGFAMRGNYRVYREGWDVLYRHAKLNNVTLTERAFYDDVLQTATADRPRLLHEKYGISSDVMDAVDKKHFRDVRGKSIVR